MVLWFRKWHVVLAIIIGLYLAIPKPDAALPMWGTVDRLVEGTELVTKTGQTISLLTDLTVKERNGFIEISRNDAVSLSGSDQRTEEEIKAAGEDPALHYVPVTNEVEKLYQSTGGKGVKFPLSAYKVNLGQDLAGGSTLRYRIQPARVQKARARLESIYQGWKARTDLALPENVRAQLNAMPAAFPELGDEVDAIRQANVVSDDQLNEFASAIEEYNTARNETKAADMVGQVIESLQRRLNASGMTELNIVSAGANEIEIKLPNLGSAERDRIKNTLQSTGELQFLLLPDRREVFVGDETIDSVYPGLPEKNSSYYRWYDVLPSQTAANLFDSNQLSFDSSRQLYVESEASRTTPTFNTTFGVVTDRLSPPITFVTKDGTERKAIIKIEACLVQVLYPDEDGKGIDGYPISGDALKNVEPSTNQEGRPAVAFELKGRGVAVMSELTGKHNTKTAPQDDQRLLAMAIDQKLYSSASINDRLSDNIQISGSFTRNEVKQYVDTLKSGSLPVSLELQGEENVGPAEGADNITRGVASVIIGAVLVFLFALAFYGIRVGSLTIINLTLTMVLIMAIMAMFLSTLTLPGIAGLVLTLGMAIDSNILINERIKEEMLGGSTGRAAVENGFGKSMSAIVDGNVTTLLTAIILSKVGTGAVAGFALTLSVGILCTLYTALLVYKTNFFWCYDKGFVKAVGGFNLFPNSKFDFLRVGKKLAIINVILMAASFSWFVYEAGIGHIFGIDFRGGTQVVVQLSEPMTRDDMNATFKDSHPEMQAQGRLFFGEEDLGGKFTRWELRFPTREGDEATDAAIITENIERDVRQTLSQKLVPDGFTADIVNPTRADLTLTVETQVANPADFDTATSWLEQSAGWEDPERWLNATTGGTFEALTFTTEGNSQRVTFTLRDVNVSDELLKPDSPNSRIKQLIDTVTSKLYEAPGENRLLTRAPLASDIVVQKTQGEIRADIKLLSPIKTSDFNVAVKSALKNSTDPLVNDLLTAVPVNEVDGNASAFFVKTNAGELPWADGENTSLNAMYALEADLESYFKEADINNHISKPIPRASAIGGRVAGETQIRAILALVIALIVIVIYITIRFKSSGWGYAAVAALIHDTLFTLGAIAVLDSVIEATLGFDLKFDLNAVAALLTVIGYSLNDTIVIFDRVREELVDDLNSTKKRPLSEVLNTAINRTLSRSVLTSGSTFVVVLAMVVFGGPAIRTFAWTLFFGLIFGTYSSIFRAGPFLLFFTGSKDIREEVEREEAARKEAERAEAEALAAISLDREVEEEGDAEAGTAKA